MKTKTKTNKRSLIAISALIIAIIGILFYYYRFSHNEVYVECRLAEQAQEVSFSFAAVYDEEEYDSVVIVLPYQKVEGFGIDMPSADRRMIDSYAMGNECSCTLIFTKEGELVAYASVLCIFFDFASDKTKNRYAKEETFATEGGKVVIAE